jgi:hypothetical protein
MTSYNSTTAGADPSKELEELATKEVYKYGIYYILSTIYHIVYLQSSIPTYHRSYVVYHVGLFHGDT